MFMLINLSILTFDEIKAIKNKIKQTLLKQKLEKKKKYIKKERKRKKRQLKQDKNLLKKYQMKNESESSSHENLDDPNKSQEILNNLGN